MSKQDLQTRRNDVIENTADCRHTILRSSQLQL